MFCLTLKIIFRLRCIPSSFTNEINLPLYPYHYFNSCELIYSWLFLHKSCENHWYRAWCISRTVTYLRWETKSSRKDSASRIQLSLLHIAPDDPDGFFLWALTNASLRFFQRRWQSSTKNTWIYDIKAYIVCTITKYRQEIGLNLTWTVLQV